MVGATASAVAGRCPPIDDGERMVRVSACRGIAVAARTRWDGGLVGWLVGAAHWCADADGLMGIGIGRDRRPGGRDVGDGGARVADGGAAVVDGIGSGMGNVR